MTRHGLNTEIGWNFDWGISVSALEIDAIAKAIFVKLKK